MDDYAVYGCSVVWIIACVAASNMDVCAVWMQCCVDYHMCCYSKHGLYSSYGPLLVNGVSTFHLHLLTAVPFHSVDGCTVPLC